MGYLKDIHTNLDIQAFPGAQFEIAGDVPAPQCSEAKIESTVGEIFLGNNFILDFGKFVGWALAGKKVTVILPLSDAGTYNITSNDNNQLNTDNFFTVRDSAVSYYVHNGGELILTRNVPSFAAYIHAAGYAYTIKAGKLYTNMPSDQLQNACTILFDPLT